LEILFSVQASLQGSQIPLTEIRPPLARNVLREAIRITFSPGGITQMNVLRNLACGLFCSLVLSGCAQYQWQKYGANQNDFNRDSYECQMEAARTFPTQLVSQQVTAAYTTPTYTNCSGNGYGSYRYSNCTTTGGQYVPAYSTTVDANANNRAQAARQCMYVRGWQLIQVK
jgi:hypothetical protein